MGKIVTGSPQGSICGPGLKSAIVVGLSFACAAYPSSRDSTPAEPQSFLEIGDAGVNDVRVLSKSPVTEFGQ